MKRILPVLLGAILYAAVTFAASQVSAASLTVDTIGTTSFTTGATTWTYYGTNPVFQGSASPSATVSLSVDGVSEGTDTADTNGNWSITPTSLDTVGSYDIQFTSGSETVSFTLSIASSSASTTSTKGGTSTASSNVDLPEELPQTGSEDIVFLLTIGGLMLAAGISSSLILRNN